MQNQDSDLIFVEVKCVDHTTDLTGYITRKKLSTLHRAIEYYASQTQIKYRDLRLDIVFVKHHQIYEIFPNISF